MKRLLFFGCKVGFDVGSIGCNYRVITICHSRFDLGRMAVKVTDQGDAFGGNPLHTRIIRRGQAPGLAKTRG
jgi:hypothetical protein